MQHSWFSYKKYAQPCSLRQRKLNRHGFRKINQVRSWFTYLGLTLSSLVHLSWVLSATSTWEYVSLRLATKWQNLNQPNQELYSVWSTRRSKFCIIEKKFRASLLQFSFNCFSMRGFQKFAKSVAAVEIESEKSKTGSCVNPPNTLQACKYTYFLNVLVVTSVVGFLNNWSGPNLCTIFKLVFTTLLIRFFFKVACSH